MIKHAILKLINTKYRQASAEVEKAKRLIMMLSVTGSLSAGRR